LVPPTLDRIGPLFHGKTDAIILIESRDNAPMAKAIGRILIPLPLALSRVPFFMFAPMRGVMSPLSGNVP